MGETEEERRIRKEKERKERPKETEEERRIRKEKERERDKDRERRKETEEERAARKERERAEGKDRPRETEEERAARKEKERQRDKERPKETEEERAARKEKERSERDKPRETEEERAARKERERAERDKDKDKDRRKETDKDKRRETEEERAARKERERAERDKPKETEEERAARKERERAERDKPKETEEERAARKERERAERDKPKETEEERAARKERERAERDKPKETEEERAIRKEKERQERKEKEGKKEETEEERAARKEKEKGEKKEKEKKKKKEEDEDDGYGDDDFEEYADEFDDFEDEEEEDESSSSSDDSSDSSASGSNFMEKQNKRMMAMKKAMERENKELEKTKKDREKGKKEKKAESKSVKSNKPKRMDPQESKRQDKLKKKYLQRMERAQLLVRLVDLDTVTYEIADIAPQSEYDLYISSFGASGASQATTQIPDTNEIDTTEVQTEKIHFKNKDIQVPEDLGLFAQPTGLIPQEKKKKEEPKFIRIDTIGLGRFIGKSYPVFRVLLNESERASDSGMQKSNFEFSSTFLSMTCLPLLAGRSVVGMSFSEINQQFLMAVYSPTKIKNPLGVNPDDDISHLDGVAAVWNVNNPQTPHLLHVANGALTCGCWSAKKGYLMFAGSRDGAVYVWDQREPDHMHANSIRSIQRKPKGRKGTQAATPRYPTYSTEWMWKENHTSPIVRILPVGYNSRSQADASEQIATLDCDGTIMFWVIVEVMQKGHDISDSDFGLNIFGGIKLVKSSQLMVNNPQRYMRPEMITSLDAKDRGREEGVGLGARAKSKEEAGLLPTIATFDLEFQPDDPSQVMIASDTGYVLHNSRFSHTQASPSTYLSTPPNEYLEPHERAKHMAIARDLKYGTSILCLHYCPTDPRFFAAAYDDGTISLFKTEDNLPKTTFKDFTTYPIICVRWSNQNRGVLFAMDSAGTIFAFDLMRERPEQQLEPFSKSNVAMKVSQDGKEKVAMPTAIDFSSDLRTDAKLAIAYNDGHIDLHALKPDFIKQERNEGFFVAFY